MTDTPPNRRQVEEALAHRKKYHAYADKHHYNNGEVCGECAHALRVLASAARAWLGPIEGYRCAECNSWWATEEQVEMNHDHPRECAGTPYQVVAGPKEG